MSGKLFVSSVESVTKYLVELFHSHNTAGEYLMTMEPKIQTGEFCHFSTKRTKLSPTQLLGCIRQTNTTPCCTEDNVLHKELKLTDSLVQLLKGMGLEMREIRGLRPS